MLNATHHAVAHALVDSSTPCCVQMTNPSSRVLTVRKRFRLRTVTKPYESDIITVTLSAALTALAVAVTMEPDPAPVPAPTRGHVSTRQSGTNSI